MIVLKFSSDSVDFIFSGTVARSKFSVQAFLDFLYQNLFDLLVASLNCLDVVKKFCNWILR